MKQIKTGTVTGTGAAINVPLGFNPTFVQVLNLTSATLEQLEWFSGMAEASAIKTVAGGTRTKITTLGISTYAGSTTESSGFTIGADTDVNVAAEVIAYIAIRGE